MAPNFNTFLPEGFSTVNSYLFVSHPELEIEFLKKAFAAKELNRTIDKQTGTVGNCILKIGHSCLMISQARGDFENMRTAFYLFVENVDEAYQNALKHGATDCFAPVEMDYEDYQGGIIDPNGNYWWISKRMVKKSYQD